MTRQKVVFILAMLFFFAGSACAQTEWKRVSSFTFDWDGHKGVHVVLDNSSQGGDPATSLDSASAFRDRRNSC